MLTDLKRESLGRKLYESIAALAEVKWANLDEQEKHRYMSAAENLYWIGRSENR